MILDLHMDALKNRPPRKGDLNRNLRVGYVRESVGDYSQPLTEQITKTKGCHKVFCDKFTRGTSQTREKLFHFLREGDTLVVTRLDRLATSLDDLISAISELSLMKVDLVVLDENINTKNGRKGDLFSTLDSIACALETWQEEEMAAVR